jgi:DNA invertase Pin-like site-specific DNA recombinase
MLVGYARTSTLEQVAGFEAQLRELKAAGCEGKIFSEQVSSVAKREQLEAALDYVREGDVLVVAKLDRLARSMRDLMEIVDTIKFKRASLRILNMNLDTGTPTGELILNVLGSIAQFERAMMLERQREGIAKAKAEGKYKGRAPTARAKADEARELHAQGVGAVEIAKRLGIGRSSVYRAIAEEELDRSLDDAINTMPELDFKELDRLLGDPTDIPGLDDIDKEFEELDRLPL